MEVADRRSHEVLAEDPPPDTVRGVSLVKLIPQLIT
ncbi:MAG: hypothetical protein ACI92I_000014 [Acidimicrobiales bacterium]|jgi:hypothetical protein